MLTTIISAMLFFAFFNERAIEKFVSDPTRYQHWLVALSIVLGLIEAFAFKLDAVAAFLATLGPAGSFVEVVPFIGTIITGFAIGFGATFIHDLFDAKS